MHVKTPMSPEQIQAYWQTEEDFILRALDCRDQLLADPACHVAMQEILCSLDKNDVNDAHKRIDQLTENALEKDASLKGMIVPAVLLCALPEALKRFHAEGIDDIILKDTFPDICLWLDFFRKREGFDGVDELPWILYPYAGRLLTFGRLMYESCAFPYPFRFYRSKKSGNICILTEDGEKISPDGHIVGASHIHCDPAFVTELTEEDGMICGHPADAENGIVLNERICISEDEYELCLKPGMPILSIHIPEGGKLSPEAVDASLDQARRHYKKQGYPADMFLCESWMLDANLKDMLPDHSNILRFANRYLRFPVLAPDFTAPKYIFGPAAADTRPQDLAEDTPLQRAMKAFLMRGGKLYDTGGLMFIDLRKDI